MLLVFIAFLAMAKKAINTKSIEATLTANFNPSIVPFEIASKTLLPIFSLETSTLESIFIGLRN